ncbi:MAG: hypothetical protein C6P35_00830 [Cohnella sp.]|nr:MAG: hypothetical protein C6P35_00830 [Cohnella sp.]
MFNDGVQLLFRYETSAQQQFSDSGPFGRQPRFRGDIGTLAVFPAAQFLEKLPFLLQFFVPLFKLSPELPIDQMPEAVNFFL